MFSDRFKGLALKLVGVAALVFAFCCLGVLLSHVFQQGFSSLSWDFLNEFPSRIPARAGIKSALFGTLWIMGLTALFSIPIGVLTAVYLEEFAGEGVVRRFIQVNIANLAGVPSIIYGMLGLAVFVRALSLGRSVLAGALTMALLVLPVIVIATSEALRMVPSGIRLAGYGVGATRRQVVFAQVLPEAWPGILTGIILALSRAIGESAPLIMIGALSFVAFIPEGPMDSFTVLAIQIFNWAQRPQPEFHTIAATGIIVLLAITLGMNAVAIYFRVKLSRKKGRT